MAFEQFQEQANNVPLVSLAGVQGSPNRGRVLVSDVVGTGVGTAVYLLQPNQRRIVAFFQNQGQGTATAILTFGVPKATYYGIWLRSGDTFQIDKNFPWVGPVILSCTAGTTYIAYTEISVP